MELNNVEEKNNKMGTGMGNGEEGSKAGGEGKKKRGRKRKDEAVELLNPKDQNKFFIDVSKEPENKELILNFLYQANEKVLGREIILKDLVLASLPKLNQKDIEKIQEGTLTEMEKVERALDEYNKKHESKLTMGEFLVKRLGIS